VDPKGWRMCNNLCLLLDGQLERFETLFNTLLSFVDVCIPRMGGFSYFSEFWWIHRGVGCEITGANFSSQMTLYNASLSFVPRGAVVRAEAQRSDDPCVPGSNPTVGRGCRSFG
jgi:hypothetical protein